MFGLMLSISYLILFMHFACVGPVKKKKKLGLIGICFQRHNASREIPADSTVNTSRLVFYHATPEGFCSFPKISPAFFKKHACSNTHSNTLSKPMFGFVFIMNS